MVGLADGASHPELGDASTTVAQLRDNLEGSINKSIAVMTADQQAVKRLLDRLRELTHGDQTQADICTLTKALILRAAQLEANAHLHMQAESNHLFLAAGAL